MPAVGQGAIAVEARLKDTEAADALAKLDDLETRTAIIAERALLAALHGGCQLPLGAWAATTNVSPASRITSMPICADRRRNRC